MTDSRRVLVVSRSRVDDGVTLTGLACQQLIGHGLIPVLTAEEFSEAKANHAALGAGDDSHVYGVEAAKIQILGRDCAESDLELAIVLGGDGTILKAAEIVRAANTPLLGINLGHVGFLAEGERHELSALISRVAAKDYQVTERLALDVSVLVGGEQVYSTWALNEATVEKSSRERMLEVVIEVEGHPLSSFGCDGVVMATPTGSTAYAFSAGGPVVWPSVEALLMVPLSAHALFSRPLVVNPDSMLAVEVLRRSAGSGVLWCDGRRTYELAPGSRVEVRRSEQPVRIVRLSDSPFTNRLVSKFALPVAGWRGPEA
jgi:NAD+ kinase